MKIELDGYLGEYKGHRCYLMEPSNYFAHKDQFDGMDVIFIMTDKDILVHRGKVLGKLAKNKQVVPNVDAKLSDYYKEALPKKIVKKEEYTVEDVVPTKPKTVVTERHTVEWYTDHTIKMLNEGVGYGELKLKDFAAEGKRKCDAMGNARDPKVIT